MVQELGFGSAADEENLLKKVMQTPYDKLVESYARSNGYIGVGLHSADRFLETRLQDGETVARLLSYLCDTNRQFADKEFRHGSEK